MGQHFERCFCNFFVTFTECLRIVVNLFIYKFVLSINVSVLKKRLYFCINYISEINITCTYIEMGEIFFSCITIKSLMFNSERTIISIIQVFG